MVIPIILSRVLMTGNGRGTGNGRFILPFFFVRRIVVVVVLGVMVAVVVAAAVVGVEVEVGIVGFSATDTVTEAEDVPTIRDTSIPDHDSCIADCTRSSANLIFVSDGSNNNLPSSLRTERSSRLIKDRNTEAASPTLLVSMVMALLSLEDKYR
jgi:hypothetical protein